MKTAFLSKLFGSEDNKCVLKICVVYNTCLDHCSSNGVIGGDELCFLEGKKISRGDSIKTKKMSLPLMTLKLTRQVGKEV